MSRYFCVSTGYFSNAKTLQLADRIGERAFYLPLRMWAYAALNQPDCDFSDERKYTLEVFAQEIFRLRKKEEASEVLKALQELGWFEEGTRKFKGWQEWNEFVVNRPGLARHAAQARWKRREPEPPPPNPDPPGEKKAPQAGRDSPRPRNESKGQRSGANDEDVKGYLPERKRESEALDPRTAAAKSAALERKLKALDEELSSHIARPDSSYRFKTDALKSAARKCYEDLKAERAAALSALGNLKI